MPFDVENNIPPGAKIKVIGVGGAGGNAVNTMIQSNLDGVDFIVANTDVQSLRFSLAKTKIQLGKELTKGLGAGADPDVGRDAALEDRLEIAEILSGSDMVFITGGMGGGTGTGAAAVISQIARELGALTVGVVTKPFDFEGKRRKRHAELGIERLKECVDTLITIPNQKLLQIATPDLTMMNAFKMADNVLVNAVRGISDIINVPGTVNVDFADVKTVMSSMGHALMGIGVASGPKRAIEAAKQAISSPLLEDIDIEGATGILINITAASNISLIEISEACSIIQDAAHEEANIIFGAAIDEGLGEEIRVTVIATGFPMETNAPAKAANDLQLGQQAAKKNILNHQPAHHYQSAMPSPTNRRLIDKAKPGSPAATSQSAPSGQAHASASFGSSSQGLHAWNQGASGENLNRPEDTLMQSFQSTRPGATRTQQASAAASGLSYGFAGGGESQSSQSSSGTTGGNLPKETEELAMWTMQQLEEPQAATPSADKGSYHEAEDIKLANSQSFDQASRELELQGKYHSRGSEPNFSEYEINNLEEELSGKIDHALDIAERLHGNMKNGPQIDHDDLDVPAFIRNGMKDIPIA